MSFPLLRKSIRRLPLRPAPYLTPIRCYKKRDPHNEPARNNVRIALNLLFPGLAPINNAEATENAIEALKKDPSAQFQEVPRVRIPVVTIEQPEQLQSAYREYQEALFLFGKPENPEGWMQEQTEAIRERKLPVIFRPEADAFFEGFDFMFPIYSSSQFVTSSMVYSQGPPIYEKNARFNELVELDKLRDIIKFNPMYLVGAAEHIGKVYQELFTGECQSKEIAEYLTRLRTLGEKAVTYYLALYVPNRSEPLDASSIIRDWCFPKIVKSNQTLVDAMIAEPLNTLYQYFGLITLVNGPITRECIHSMVELGQPETPTKKEDVRLVLSDEEKQLLEEKTKHYYHIGLMTLESVDAYTSLNKVEAPPVKELTPEETAILGFLVYTSFSTACQFLGVEPVFTKARKQHIVQLFNSSETEWAFPELKRNNTPSNPLEVTVPLVNENRVNNILMMQPTQGDTDLDKIIKRNSGVAGARYEYFLKIAFTRHLLEYGFHANELLLTLSGQPFKQYIQSRFSSEVPFNQIFGCMSEQQKLEWTDDMVNKLKTVMQNLDAFSLDFFLHEFKDRVRKRSQVSITTHGLNRLLQCVDEDNSGDTYLRDLGAAFVRYAYTKSTMGVMLHEVILTIRAVEAELNDIQLSKIGKIVSGNRLEENEAFEQSLLDAIELKGTSNSEAPFVMDVLTEGIPAPTPQAARVKRPFLQKVDLKNLKLPIVECTDNLQKAMFINYYILPKTLRYLRPKNRKVEKAPLLELVSKTALLGRAYFDYVALYKLRTNSINDVLKEKKVIRDICRATGLHDPYTDKFKYWYRNSLKMRNINEYNELVTYVQMFNQYLGLLYTYHRKELDLYIDNVVAELIK
ncbi:hypothetical protein Cantr_05484 [Candida viswanathii]|uniref:Uncharacterized protein n=1 Tax=Candida viswanathii TaxID=5486 RepID=A0A367XSE8_9ASCO|nr:hypothetical protein Cantr_05484 [Candida viswanathii]